MDGYYLTKLKFEVQQQKLMQYARRKIQWEFSPGFYKLMMKFFCLFGHRKKRLSESCYCDRCLKEWTDDKKNALQKHSAHLRNAAPSGN